MPNRAHDQLLSFSCCIVRVVMMAISLHLLLWVGILKVWPGFCHETRSFYAERFAPDQWLQRSPGRLRLARKPVFFVALKDCLRLEKGSSSTRSKTRLLAASERCDQHFSSAIPHFETDSGAFYSPETLPHQHLLKIHRCTDVEFKPGFTRHVYYWTKLLACCGWAERNTS